MACIHRHTGGDISLGFVWVSKESQNGLNSLLGVIIDKKHQF